MKILALCTALVMSAATAASADPPQTYDRDRDSGVTVNVSRDHYDRYRQSKWARDFHGRWTQLSAYATLPNTRQFVPAASHRYRKLRIEGVRGAPTILKVAIQFDNGATQIVDMNTPLTSGTGEVLDLSGGVRSVHRVIVYSDPQTRGSYTVYGA